MANQTTAIETSDPLLDTKQLTEITSTTPEFWEILRCKGGGPEFIKVGRLVRYKKSAVDRWFAERTVQSTAEARGLKRRKAG
jgi:predicted DNA-binding transcriptional regulator AlpA